jgi:predicted alpha/beta-fold hydrolase
VNVIPAIRTPTTIITAQDDPFVPFEMFSSDCVRYPENVRLVTTNYGGHVGFVGKKGDDPDMRWLDWRIVEIVTGETIS